MVTGLLGSQSAVAAGGRYDGLIADLGGPQLPGIGFAMGVERVALLLAEQEFRKRPDLFIAALGEEAQREAFKLMCALQRLDVRVEIDYEGKSLKSQMRRANKLNSCFSIVIGEKELILHKTNLKNMDVGDIVFSSQQAINNVAKPENIEEEIDLTPETIAIKI